ncbi:sigma-70 family RNA polymerase sigma factor [[Acholeplasma] multilocale]|uniref:sigma-70 family RNA polymerase sigma factor n=1 Tax=[Acholeplasma] multilocale TaxID=264638 RepID=UPI00047EF675|nr:sigma-70 family RNA polymerase sigma factor [[Acholeplasma] multilocale]
MKIIESKRLLEQFSHFNKIGLSNLCEEDKVRLFKIYEGPVEYAINKAFMKFKSLPLEKSDLELAAWSAFEKSLQIFNTKKLRKNFLSFLVDAIYWKCMDACVTYINNRYKVLNQALEMFVEQDGNNPQYQDDFATNISNEDCLRKYFAQTNEEFAEVIFRKYVEGHSRKSICDDLNISRNRMTRILEKTITELRPYFE